MQQVSRILSLPEQETPSQVVIYVQWINRIFRNVNSFAGLVLSEVLKECVIFTWNGRCIVHIFGIDCLKWRLYVASKFREPKPHRHDATSEKTPTVKTSQLTRKCKTSRGRMIILNVKNRNMYSVSRSSRLIFIPSKESAFYPMEIGWIPQPNWTW